MQRRFWDFDPSRPLSSNGNQVLLVALSLRHQIISSVLHNLQPVSVIHTQGKGIPVLPINKISHMFPTPTSNCDLAHKSAYPAPCCLAVILHTTAFCACPPQSMRDN